MWSCRRVQVNGTDASFWGYGKMNHLVMLVYADYPWEFKSIETMDPATNWSCLSFFIQKLFEEFWRKQFMKNPGKKHTSAIRGKGASMWCTTTGVVLVEAYRPTATLSRVQCCASVNKSINVFDMFWSKKNSETWPWLSCQCVNKSEHKDWIETCNFVVV